MRQTRDVQDLAGGIVEIARAAGEAIREIHDAWAEGEDAGRLSYKADDSPLTIADLAAHQTIAGALRRLTPDIGVVSEEDAGSLRHRLPSGEFWLVDPLDGTKEFLARSGEFTVNIALVRDGVPVLGVVYAPIVAQMYWGGQGIGAFRDSAGVTAPIRVAAPAADAPLRVLASKSHLNAETAAFIARLGRHELVQAGSSLKFCRIAEGAADVYPRLGPTCEWDTAAAQAVVEAAGGIVHDLGGVALRYGKPEVLNPHFVAAAAPFVVTA